MPRDAGVPVRSRFDVLLRGLKELKIEAVDTVLELVAQNSLYRGEEKKDLLTRFRALKVKFDQVSSAEQQHLAVWQAVVNPEYQWVAGFKNDVIGTLVSDISEGYDLEDCVKSYEQKVAPTNYRRPTALVTQAMIDRAKQTIAELGLTPALERRFATTRDISVANVLFADRNAKKQMTGGVLDDLAPTAAASAKTYDKVEEIPVEKFISDVLPKIDTLEVMMENRHQPNRVTLVAPADPTAPPLFKWDNGFSWSYAGEVADSIIKERVKAAGGNVSGEFCCRLAWFNYDDLDLHLQGPNGMHVFYAARMDPRSGGTLDVDMNAGSGTTRTPVENIFFGRISAMPEGHYRLFVHNFNKRESVDVGFEVEIDIQGTVRRIQHPNAVLHRADVTVAEFKYSKKNGLEIVSSLPSTEISRTSWGVPTQAFQRVKMMLLSPNHWDGKGVGNRHYFFMIDGMKTDEKVRGFYNEFLRSDLEQHRKVLELVGSKMRTETADDQLSGLGFSTTQRNHVLARVKGAFTRVVKITF